MGEVRKAEVRFRVIGTGVMEIEYEVGVETPEARFLRLVEIGTSRRLTLQALKELFLNSMGDEWHVEVTGSGPAEDGLCRICEGERTVVWGDKEITCPACAGSGQETAVLTPATSPDENPPW